jgi:hypothetical protein
MGEVTGHASGYFRDRLGDRHHRLAYLRLILKP